MKKIKIMMYPHADNVDYRASMVKKLIRLGFHIGEYNIKYRITHQNIVYFMQRINKNEDS